ncbi:MAG: MFS transporter [Synergistaceae bacterium]|nr:MFS transporter [Synergistaceae bacterium]
MKDCRVPENFKHINGKNIVFIISILFAVFFAIQILGKTIYLPFPRKLILNAPSVTVLDEDKPSAIVDCNGTRLIVTDKKWEVKNIIDLDGGDLLSCINGIKRDGTYFYLWGTKEKRNSVRIAFDRIVRYDINGKNPTLIYEIKRKNEPVTLAVHPDILDVDIVKGKLYVTVIHDGDNDKNYLKEYTQILEINIDKATVIDPKVTLDLKTKMLVSADYSPEAGILYYNDLLGCLIKKDSDKSLFFPYTDVLAFVSPSRDNFFWFSSKDGNIYFNNRLILAQRYPLYFSFSGKDFTYVDFENGNLHWEKFNGELSKTITEIPYSTHFAVMTFIRFISAIYLILIILYLIVRVLYVAYVKGRVTFLKRIGIFFCLAIIALFIAVFYSEKFAERDLNALKENINIYGKFFAETIEQSRIVESNTLRSIDEKIAYYNHHDNYYGKLRDICAENNHYIFVVLYKITDGKVSAIYTSEEKNLFYNNVDIQLLITKGDYGKVNIYSSYGRKVYFCLYPIKNDSGDVIGVIEVGQDYLTHQNQVRTVCLEMFITLLTIFVGVAIIFTEGKAFLVGLRKRKQAVIARENNTELALLRPAVFLFNLVSSFDEVILVLIAKEMLTASGVTGNQILFFMSIPALVMGIGRTLGRMIYPFLARKFTVRRLALTGITLMVTAYVGIVYAVLQNYFVLFCVLKFFSNTFDSVVFCILRSMPYRAKSEDEIYEFIQSKELVNVSSSIFGTLIGGIASQTFGNATMYTINTVAFIPIILLLFVMMPQNTYYVQKSQRKGKLNEVRKLLFNVPMISFWLFLTVPVIIVSGYKSFLFPIYTAALSLPKMYITTFSVLAKTVTMMLAGTVISKLKNIDFWKKSILFLATLGIAFLGFAVNTTIVWAIIMLVITELLDKIINPAKDMLWSRMARTQHIDIIEASNSVSLIESFFASFKETFLSFFLLFGNNLACVLVGGCCIICAAIFTLLTRHTVFVCSEDKISFEESKGM